MSIYAAESAKYKKNSKKINKNLNDLKLIFLELVHLGLCSGKVWENRFFLYCMTLVDPYSKLLLRCDPTGVNCCLGVVLSFVEKKLVLLFSDFFSHLKLPEKTRQNKGREGGRNKRERKIKRREKEKEGEKRFLDN